MISHGCLFSVAVSVLEFSAIIFHGGIVLIDGVFSTHCFTGRFGNMSSGNFAR